MTARDSSPKKAHRKLTLSILYLECKCAVGLHKQTKTNKTGCNFTNRNFKTEKHHNNESLNYRKAKSNKTKVKFNKQTTKSATETARASKTNRPTLTNSLEFFDSWRKQNASKQTRLCIVYLFPLTEQPKTNAE